MDFRRGPNTEMDRFLTEVLARYNHIGSLGVQVHTYNLVVMVLRICNITTLQQSLVLMATNESFGCYAICKSLTTLCRGAARVSVAHFNQNKDRYGNSEAPFLWKIKGENDAKTGVWNGPAQEG